MGRDQRRLPLALDYASKARAIDNRQRGVEQDREVHDEALSKPIFRQISYPRPHRLVRRAEGHIDSIHADRADVELVDAEDHAGDLGATAADEPSKPYDLPGVDLKRHV